MRGSAYRASLTAVLASATLGCAEQPSSNASTIEQSADGLPRITWVGLSDLIQSEAAAGRVVVVHFWASWCLQCTQMMPILHEGLAEVGDKATSISVSFDPGFGEYEAAAIDFLTKHDSLNHAYITPDQEDRKEIVEHFGSAWQDALPPALFVYDAQGNIALEVAGFSDPVAVAEQTRSLVISLVDQAHLRTDAASHKITERRNSDG